jgi:GLPGLI family protein
LKHITITVNLKDKWHIDYKKTKIIDGYKCYYAEYKGKGLWWEFKPEKPISAWFTNGIPLPFGPLHYNGLPGLIIELNVENVRYTATKIAFDNTYKSKLITKDLSKYEVMTEEEFIRDRADIRRKAKRILIGG